MWSSASNNNANVTEYNQTLGGTIPTGLTGSFSMTMRATGGNGGTGNARSSVDGTGVQGQNAQRIDWATSGNQVSEVLFFDVDLSTATGVDGLEFLGFTTGNTHNARAGVTDVDGGDFEWDLGGTDSDIDFDSGNLPSAVVNRAPSRLNNSTRTTAAMLSTR